MFHYTIQSIRLFSIITITGQGIDSTFKLSAIHFTGSSYIFCVMYKFTFNFIFTWVIFYYGHKIKELQLSCGVSVIPASAIQLSQGETVSGLHTLTMTNATTAGGTIVQYTQGQDGQFFVPGEIGRHHRKIYVYFFVACLFFFLFDLFFII